MLSLRDRAVFFPPATFDDKDKSKTHTHLQGFEDFVDRQKLDPEKDFKEIQEYFLMTLHNLARKWFTSTKFTSCDDMKKGVMCGNTSLTIREAETLMSKELYIQVEYICLLIIFPY